MYIYVFNVNQQMEMELLDENIRMWSAGKETNIRLLLSTLHHVRLLFEFYIFLNTVVLEHCKLTHININSQILWPTSGWYAIPLTSLIESSRVKKAYQKARLCLHPDKLQQRGATVKQKYIADKAFSILQVNLMFFWA